MKGTLGLLLITTALRNIKTLGNIDHCICSGKQYNLGYIKSWGTVWWLHTSIAFLPGDSLFWLERQVFIQFLLWGNMAIPGEDHSGVSLEDLPC